MSDKKSLDDIFDDDPFGLLNVKPKGGGTPKADDRLTEKFREIVKFYEEHQRPPEAGPDVAMEERTLYMRLKGLKDSPESQAALKNMDTYGLLGDQETKPIHSLDDVLDDDSLGLLEPPADDIFNLTHIPKEKQTTMPDYVGSRVACKDFGDFEPLFIQCQQDLKFGKRKLYPFKNEQQIAVGSFFALKGVLLLVAGMGDKYVEKGKRNARLRCIFENGTESDMLLRSLAAELYKHGRRVTEHEERYLHEMKDISDEDKATGYIYVLKSKSTRPDIAGIRNLYKIGYATTSVEDRVKHAEQEPTFLMAPVEIIAYFQCYNMNTQKLELLLHTFFGNSCLSVDVFDAEGKRYTPREWFIAPYEVIRQAIEFIKTGDIVDYRYDAERQEIVGR